MFDVRSAWFAISLAGLFASAAPAGAADVSGSYEGTVTDDSGLGVAGQTMRFDFTYDDSTLGIPSFGSHNYTDAIVSATLTIGAEVWIYAPSGQPNSNTLVLGNDQTIISVVGDSFTLASSDYSGSDFGTGRTSSFFFRVELGDDEPVGAPDGLTQSTPLPSEVPDPELFTSTSIFLPNRMTLSWQAGDPELGGTAYAITASGDLRLALPPATVPVPLWALPVAAAIILGAGARRLRA